MTVFRRIIVIVLVLAPCSVAGQDVRPAPALTLKDINGRTLRLDNYRGKVVLLNFWATWCPPCRVEVPHLVKLQHDHGSRGLQVIGVTYPPQTRAQVRRLARQVKINYPVALGTRENKALFYPGGTLPITVIIDREGNVREVIEGILYAEEFDAKVKPLLPSAQTPRPADVWLPFKYFIGTWEGTGQGESGTSRVEREYKFVLNRKFINVTHKSIYPPQEKNPKGETHDDWAFLSYDRGRKSYVMRQFHVEGFVTQYLSAAATLDGKTFVFTSEGLENLPAGWKARETYRIVNDNEFVEVFELAAPGKEFSVYSENRFTRKKSRARKRGMNR